VRISLHVRSGRPTITEFATGLRRAIEEAGSEIVTVEGEKPDMVLAVGGDGTMLGAARRALAWDVPVLGFNLGTLGFLARAEPSEMESVVGRLLSGEFEVDERLTVSADIGAGAQDGVNDVVVEKIDSTRLVSLEVVVDEIPFTTYRADGLIVATPTGSTAYSFSAGGPVVDPGVSALVLTPVAAHSLFDRPIVLPADSKITVKVRGDRPVRVNVDKTSLGNIGDGGSVAISAGSKPARFVTFGPVGFPGLVREKFGLG
jgi:NAD+ kinase